MYIYKILERLLLKRDNSADTHTKHSIIRFRAIGFLNVIIEV